jgi:hypothetical protein
MGVWDMMPQALVAHFDPGPAPAPPTVQLAQPGHLVIHPRPPFRRAPARPAPRQVLTRAKHAFEWR